MINSFFSVKKGLEFDFSVDFFHTSLHFTSVLTLPFNYFFVIA